MKLLRRILVEKRMIALPLFLVLLLDVGVYALVVYPLGVRSAGAGNRAAAAAAALQVAEQDQAAARALVEGKTRADEELATFYDKVLPIGLSAARDQTYARLPALARRADMKLIGRQTEIDPSIKSQRIGRLHVRVVLQGEYENLRQFIYELETAPEFLIIDDVTLSQGEPGQPLTLVLELSTYFRLSGNGT